MRGNLFAKLVSVAIALAMLVSLAAVSLAESGEEEPVSKVFIVSFNMNRYIKHVETEAGALVKKPDKAPEREGYVFSYWFVKGDPHQEPYDFSLPVTGSLKLEPLYLLLAPAADPHEEDDIIGEEPGEEGIEGDPEAPPDPLDDPEPEDPELDDPPADPNPESPTDDPGPDNPPDNPDTADPAPDDPEPEDPVADDPDDDEDDGDEDDVGDEPEIAEHAPLPERFIRIWTDAPGEVEEGYLITLQCELTGYLDCILSLRWQYSTDSGVTWQDAVGGTAYSYIYPASVEMSRCLWRLSVTVMEEP